MVCPNPSIDAYAWFADFKVGEVNRMTRIDSFPGGKGTHVALALTVLGNEVSLMGAWAGNQGEWIKKECAAYGVQTLGPIIEGNNRKCYTFRSGNEIVQNTELLEPGPNWDDVASISFEQTYIEALQRTEWVCVSGSFPLNASDYAYSSLVSLAVENDKKIVIDCSGKQLEGCINLPFFGLHLNEHEARALTGEATLESILNKVHPDVQLIALTKGKEGLLLYYQGRKLHAKLVIDNVISTVGSGDCLTAGIMFALSEGMEIEDIARYGVACGAANCMYEPLGMLLKKDVEALLPKTIITTVS